MFIANRIVDAYFLADMIINFNTAVFDAKSGCWITDRGFIAQRYMENWFAIDVISILPYDVLSVSKSFNRFRLLRTLKVLKLLKLLRVVRIGRLLNWWASRLQLSFKSLSVLRFVFIIIVVLHWFACAARMLTRSCLESDAATEEIGDDYTDSKDWHSVHTIDHWCIEFEIIRTGRGKTVEYFSALHWSTRALTGDADAPNLGILILAVIAGLAGNIVTSFMIGEVAHILGNSDPASMEYKNTVDNLNAFAVENRAGKGCEIPNFKGSYLGRFPLVLADFWTRDHLSERSRP